MTLLSQFKDYIFTECSLTYEGWSFVVVDYSKSQKNYFSWVFTEGHKYSEFEM